ERRYDCSVSDLHLIFVRAVNFLKDILQFVIARPFFVPLLSSFRQQLRRELLLNIEPKLNRDCRGRQDTENHEEPNPATALARRSPATSPLSNECRKNHEKCA